MADRIQDLGVFTAYGEAREAGYEGSKAEFELGLKKSAEYAENAQASADAAAASADDAELSAAGAAESAEDAETSAGEATQSATDAAASAEAAAGSATNAATSATQAASNAQAALGDIAPVFDATKPYSVGDYVIYTDGKLYRFTDAHAAGAWTGSDAVEAPLAGEVGELKGAFGDIANAGYMSAQMIDPTKYVDGYRWNTTFGASIDADPVEASEFSIINQKWIIGDNKVLGFNYNSANIIVLGYEQSGSDYVRAVFKTGNDFVADGTHYKLTFGNNIAAVRVYVTTSWVNGLTTPLIMALNSEWDGHSEYGWQPSSIRSDIQIQQVNDLNASVDSDIQDMQKLGLGTLEDGYINSASGAAMSGDTYKRTGFVHLQADKIKVAITFSVANVGFAFYDSRKKYISGFDYTGYNVGDLKEVSVPENAYYFRYCAINANVNKMLVLVPNYADAISRIDTNPCFYAASSECRTFKKILCIGDSLTAGQFDYKEDGVTKEFNAPEYSYPSYLKAITGRDTTNAGDAGETTVSWYELHGQEDFSGHDACIIMLGRNDYVSGRETTSEERATAFANIVTKVRADNPQIPIFMATLINYYKGDAAEAMNEDIRTAATANNCYLLDIAAYGRMVLSDDAYSHCTAEGYYTLAEYFFRYISYIMHNNYTDFKTVQFVGTNRAF